MPRYVMREKANPLAVHGMFDTLASAERHLSETVPSYLARGFYADKSLTIHSFEIAEIDPKRSRTQKETTQ